MSDAEAPAGGATPPTAAPANYVDVKLHGITNVPAAWTADCGAPPMFNDHVFRYEVDVAVAGVRHTFQHGRVLQNIPLYTEFVAGAKLPPVVPNLDEEDGAVDCDVPAAAAPPKDDAAADEANATPPMTSRSHASTTGDAPAPTTATTQVPASVMWLLGPEHDTEVKEEVYNKKDAKPAPKKGAAAAAAPPPVPENVKPVAPNADAPPLCVARLPLQLDELGQFEEQVENHVPLVLTFRRVVRPNAPAEWEDAQEAKFVGRIVVPLKTLTEPGSKVLSCVVPLAPVVEPPKEDEKGKGAKKAAPKKTKGTIPAILTDELDSNEPHPYVHNGTTAQVTISCFAPVTRLPQGRPRPDLQPADMIPKRLKPPRRPVEATKQYTKEVEALIARIVRDYREHKAQQGETTSPEELRATFLQMLSSSGRSRVYQDQLVPSVQGIVKETFIRKSAPSSEEMDKVSNELYTYLLDHLHLTLNRVFVAGADAEKGVAAIEGDSVDRWRRLAQEAEVMNEFAVAAKYHQERLVQCRNRGGDEDLADVWCEYAEFCLRIRDALKAEQAYREALAVDMSHLPSLIGYGTLLLARNRFKEAEVFLQSAVDIDGNSITWACLALYYDALFLTLSDLPDEEHRRTTCVRESKYAITQAARTGGRADSTTEDVYESLAKHLLGLYQEELVNMCLARAKQSPAVDLLYARVFLQTQQYDEAASILTTLLDASPSNAEARLLLGDVYGATNKSSESEAQYDAALRIDPQCGNGPAYVRLGNMYVALGKHKDALSAFLMGAKVWPCGLSWLGVGIAYYRMDDLIRAEQALNESNILNNLNPKTWAYLALVCLRQRREDEGDQAFNQAVKLSINDAHLIAEVGAEQLRLSRHKIAEACFRRSIALNDDCNTRMYLARTLAGMKRLGEARDEYAHVARMSTNDAQRARAEEQLQTLPCE